MRFWTAETDDTMNRYCRPGSLLFGAAARTARTALTEQQNASTCAHSVCLHSTLACVLLRSVVFCASMRAGYTEQAERIGECDWTSEDNPVHGRPTPAETYACGGEKDGYQARKRSERRVDAE